MHQGFVLRKKPYRMTLEAGIGALYPHLILIAGSLLPHNLHLGPPGVINGLGLIGHRTMVQFN
jgi:hypothetical protein